MFVGGWVVRDYSSFALVEGLFGNNNGIGVKSYAGLSTHIVRIQEMSPRLHL